MKNANIREATIDAGLYAVSQWRNGDTAVLSQWELTYLTKAGREIMRECRLDMSIDKAHDIVRRAVDAGY